MRCYGEPLITHIHERLLQGRLIDATLDIYTLVRFYPTRFRTFAGRKIASLTAFIRKELPRP